MKSIFYKAGRWERIEKEIISEQPVTLSVNNVPWLTFMCTPSNLEALAVGFLFNEKVIQSIIDVASVRICPGQDHIDVWLNHAVKKPDIWTRTSGCSGGETSVNRDESQVTSSRSKNGVVLTAELIELLTTRLIELQSLYKQSGGVHTSALSDGERILITAEDIGRHNTLDKLAGICLLENINPSKCIILTTGRISSEMIQKADRLNASVVISRTSPTSLSVRIAEEQGITLIGYARKDFFTIYAHPERILCIPMSESIFNEAK